MGMVCSLMLWNCYKDIFDETYWFVKIRNRSIYAKILYASVKRKGSFGCLLFLGRCGKNEKLLKQAL